MSRAVAACASAGALTAAGAVVERAIAAKQVNLMAVACRKLV